MHRSRDNNKVLYTEAKKERAKERQIRTEGKGESIGRKKRENKWRLLHVRGGRRRRKKGGKKKLGMAGGFLEIREQKSVNSEVKTNVGR